MPIVNHSADRATPPPTNRHKVAIQKHTTVFRLVSKSMGFANLATTKTKKAIYARAITCKILLDICHASQPECALAIGHKSHAEVRSMADRVSDADTDYQQALIECAEASDIQITCSEIK